MEKKNELNRWFDEEDFTPEHDQMMVALMQNFKDYCLPFIDAPKGSNITWKIEGECGIGGYPIIYPDAIVHAMFDFNHDLSTIEDIVLEYTWEMEDSNGTRVVKNCGLSFEGRCSRCGVRCSALLSVETYRGFIDKYDGWEIKGEYKVDKKNILKFENLLRHYADNDVLAADVKKNVPHDDNSAMKVILEIKPRIISFGSVLRQLQLYKSRSKESVIILITKDARYDSLFEEQGFKVIHPNLPELPVDKTAAKAILQATLME
jgi:hypothetical protein